MAAPLKVCSLPRALCGFVFLRSAYLRGAFVMLVALLIVLQLQHGMHLSVKQMNHPWQMTMVHNTIEQVEYLWKTGPAHDFIQRLANKTMIHHHHWHPWAIVFVHVPRTSGDALRTHLFPSDDALKSGGWPFAKNNRLPCLYDELQASGELDWMLPGRRSLYQGFFSGGDLTRLQHGPWKPHWKNVRKFTVLRDPEERVLSAIKFMKTRTVFQEFQVKDLLRISSGPDTPSSWPKGSIQESVKSFLHNAVAFQLGDQMNVSLRNKSSENAVASAQALLKSMDFIGFYEDWNTDYYRLHKTIFQNFDAEQEEQETRPVFWTALRRMMFYFGTMVARARMRTKKYSAQVTDKEELELLRAATAHDQEVYNFARDLMGRPRKSLYSSYLDYLLQEGLILLAFAILSCCLVCTCCYRCCIWLSRRQPQTPRSATVQ